MQRVKRNCGSLPWKPLTYCELRLPDNAYANRYSSNGPINRTFHGNQQKQHVLLRAVFSLGSASRQLRRRRRSIQFSSVSHEDTSDQITRTVPAVQFACSRGTFCKSQCNKRMEQVGEDFSGNQPDQLSSFIGLHWTARPIERASVKGNNPSSLQSSNTVSRLQLQVARLPQPTANQ
jgi:hypothetical protein